jgi:hypothetical protein
VVQFPYSPSRFEDFLVFLHSALNARTESTAAARRAGIKQAAKATTIRSTLTPTKMEGSAGPTLNRKLRIKGVNPAAAEMPITTLSSEIFAPRDRISMTTALHRLEIPLDAIYATQKECPSG